MLEQQYDSEFQPSNLLYCFQGGNLTSSTADRVHWFNPLLLWFGKRFSFSHFMKMMWLKEVSLKRCLSVFFQATVFIDMLINTYSSKYCKSHIYPWCKCCQPLRSQWILLQEEVWIHCGANTGKTRYVYRISKSKYLKGLLDHWGECRNKATIIGAVNPAVDKYQDPTPIHSLLRWTSF